MADNYVVDPEDIVTLQDENGEVAEYEFIDLVEYEEKEYVVLLPMKEDDNEVVILRVIPCEDDPEMEEYVSVDTDEELEAVFEIFKEKNKEEFTFE